MLAPALDLPAPVLQPTAFRRCPAGPTFVEWGGLGPGEEGATRVVGL